MAIWADLYTRNPCLVLHGISRDIEFLLSLRIEDKFFLAPL